MCDTCNWQDALTLSRTLTGRGSTKAGSMGDWIEENEHVTPAQHAALERIKTAFDTVESERTARQRAKGRFR